MKSLFYRKYGYCGVALAMLLATGCTTLPAPSEQEESETPTPVVETTAPEKMPVVDSSTQEPSALPEGSLLRKKLEEHIKVQKLLDDLARYPSLSAEEMRLAQTELSNRISSSGQGNNGENRIRLAYLLSLQPGGVNDQKAITMLDAAAKNEKALASLRHLAGILRTQIQEKQRTQQKLEALRDVDRRLLDEQITGGKVPSPKTAPRKPTKTAP
ncbi:MAG: hypothetical protein FWC42_03700 [Proteobacteria bacterium]|nr:hypothetical protein [Pseudomonadota bacterium]